MTLNVIFSVVGFNVRGVRRFSYELANFFWRYLKEFAIIGMRYQCKIVEVGNQLVQGRIDRQNGQLRHHGLGYLPRVIVSRQVVEWTRDRVENFTRISLES